MTTEDYLNQLETDRQTLITNLTTKGITGLTGNETFTELVPKVLDIASGANLGDYFTKQIAGGSSSNYSYLYQNIKRIPDDTVVTNTRMYYAFASCTALESIPPLDFTGVWDMTSMCNGCVALTDVPLLDTSSVTRMRNCFSYCYNLTDESLNNILKMCANVSGGYQQTKTLSDIGITNSTTYPVSRIEALSNYQEFINAGWTIS